MGEKTMLKKQIEQMENIAGNQGLMTDRQKVTKAMMNNSQKERDFDIWLKEYRKNENIY